MHLHAPIQRTAGTSGVVKVPVRGRVAVNGETRVVGDVDAGAEGLKLEGGKYVVSVVA